ncbi:zinc finger protein 778 isoform X3 [Betta splendens]|uniref:Zinc finger protein 778 isoform X3 n=1 Tax=Betta splendens TaxID=158456 RepID=A0A9W2XCP4_BETSP|nr:zinc finger protein 778 isoform X3 [Betta splendens]
MDEAETREDGAENEPRSGDRADGHGVDPSTEDTTEVNIECDDCGLTFTHWHDYKTHLHQHALKEGEEGQTGDYRNCAAELLSGTEDNREIGSKHLEEDDLEMSSTLQTNSLGLQGDDFVPASMKDKQDFYACIICGKVYVYLVSYKKHLQQHENSNEANISSLPNLNNYECPDCGMMFTRRTRLLSHLEIHRSNKPLKLKPPRCEQCNKDFNSMKSWMSHVETHKEKPFWCLSCAKGFRDERLLDKHLQDHSLMQHKCDICSKRFQTSPQLMCHYNTHSEAQTEGLSVKDESVETSVSQDPLEDAKFEDQITLEESDCGEPMHNIKFSKALSSVESGSKSQTVESLTEQNKNEPREDNTHTDHKYWEWECVDCGMGFDDVAMLHLHYIKHAQGELPIEQFI